MFLAPTYPSFLFLWEAKEKKNVFFFSFFKNEKQFLRTRLRSNFGRIRWRLKPDTVTAAKRTKSNNNINNNNNNNNNNSNNNNEFINRGVDESRKENVFLAPFFFLTFRSEIATLPFPNKRKHQRWNRNETKNKTKQKQRTKWIFFAIVAIVFSQRRPQGNYRFCWKMASLFFFFIWRPTSDRFNASFQGSERTKRAFCFFVHKFSLPFHYPTGSVSVFFFCLFIPFWRLLTNKNKGRALKEEK